METPEEKAFPLSVPGTCCAACLEEKKRIFHPETILFNVISYIFAFLQDDTWGIGDYTIPACGGEQFGLYHSGMLGCTAAM